MGKLIGIGGVSRAGKTSLADFFAAQLHNSLVLHQDEYILPEIQIPKIKDRIDWEHPDSIDWQKWKTAILANQPNYDFIILDGLFAFHDGELEQDMDWKIYLSIDKDRFVQNKKDDQRWGEEPEWFIQHIWDSHLKYGQPRHSRGLTRIHNITNSDCQKALTKIQSL